MMRDYFPFFQRNPDITYLDTAATSQTLYTVAEDLQSFMIDHKSNAHRSGHSMGTWVDEKYYQAKNLIGQWLNINNPEYKIIFNSGASQGLYDAVQMIKGQSTGTIYIGIDFHHSLYLPFKHLADQNSFYEIKFVPLLSTGQLDLEWLRAQFAADSNDKVLAFTGVSNVLGVEQDLEAIANLADEYSCITVLDACQLIGKRKVNLSRFDFVAWSWHKVYGPMGLGCLIANKGWDLSEPVHPGGGSVTSVKASNELEVIEWQLNAGRFESGTQNLAAIVTLPRLVQWLIECEQAIIEHDKMLANFVNSHVSHTQFTQLSESQSGLISLAPNKGAVEDYSMLLDAKKIMVRAGKLCAQPLLENFNRTALIRLSWGCYTTTQELERAFDRMGEIYEKFSRIV